MLPLSLTQMGNGLPILGCYNKITSTNPLQVSLNDRTN